MGSNPSRPVSLLTLARGCSVFAEQQPVANHFYQHQSTAMPPAAVLQGGVPGASTLGRGRLGQKGRQLSSFVYGSTAEQPTSGDKRRAETAAPTEVQQRVSNLTSRRWLTNWSGRFASSVHRVGEGGVSSCHLLQLVEDRARHVKLLPEGGRVPRIGWPTGLVRPLVHSSLFQSACRLEWRHSPHPRGSRQTWPAGAADPQRENRGFPLFLPSLRPGAVSTSQKASVRSRASVSCRRRLRRRRASSSCSSSDEEVLSPSLLLPEPPAVSLLQQSLILPLSERRPAQEEDLRGLRNLGI